MSMSQIPWERLSPSQIALLKAEHLIKRSGKLELPGGAKVSTRDLAETLVAVALLANDARGVLALRIQPHKTFFGLRTVHQVFAEPQESDAPWLDSSLEARLARLAAQLQPEEQHRVQTLVYKLVEKDRSDPWRWVVETSQTALVELGILQVVQEQWLKIGVRVRVRLAASAASRVAFLPVAPVQELLEQGRRTDPQLWRRLRREVYLGIGYRRRAFEGTREDYYQGFG